MTTEKLAQEAIIRSEDTIKAEISSLNDELSELEARNQEIHTLFNDNSGSQDHDSLFAELQTVVGKIGELRNRKAALEDEGRNFHNKIEVVASNIAAPAFNESVYKKIVIGREGGAQAELKELRDALGVKMGLAKSKPDDDTLLEAVEAIEAKIKFVETLL
jgi:peptidoglycan hydrolase CwlO-like protein